MQEPRWKKQFEMPTNTTLLNRIKNQDAGIKMKKTI
jgi:hypothetical protein